MYRYKWSKKSCPPPVGLLFNNKDYVKAIGSHIDFVNVSGMRLPFFVGYDDEGKPVFDDFSKVRYLRISGGEGRGKSVGAMQIVSSMMYFTPPELLRVWILDKDGSLSVFSPNTNFFTKKIDILKCIRLLSNVLENKLNVLQYQKLSNVDELNDLVGKRFNTPMPIDLIVMDEFARTLEDHDKYKRALTLITEGGRKAGVYVIQIMQTVRASIAGGVDGGRGSAQYSNLAYGQKNKLDSQTAGVGDLSWKLPIGKAVYSSGEEDRIVRTLNVQPYEYMMASNKMLFSGLVFKDFMVRDLLDKIRLDKLK